jgi:hypothetical protein
MNVHPTRASLEFLAQIKSLRIVVDNVRMDILAMDKLVAELMEVSIILCLYITFCLFNL